MFRVNTEQALLGSNTVTTPWLNFRAACNVPSLKIPHRDLKIPHLQSQCSQNLTSVLTGRWTYSRCVPSPASPSWCSVKALSHRLENSPPCTGDRREGSSLLKWVSRPTRKGIDNRSITGPWKHHKNVYYISHWCKQFIAHFSRYLCIFSLFLLILLCVWVFASVCIYLCITWIQCPWRPERASNTLELELQMVVSHHVGARNQTQVLWKNSQCL